MRNEYNTTLFLTAVICFFARAHVFAATGVIAASPQHLVIESDSCGASTIEWTTSGCLTAQVYVSVPGGVDTLLSQNANGSKTPGWLLSGKTYVFKLYEGTSKTNLLDWVSVTSHRPPNSMFGFNYWPYDSSCWVLTDACWTQDMKDEIEADLDHMSSLSAGILRLFFWPQLSGYTIDCSGGGGDISSDHSEICNNLPELLAMCAQRDMQVIIAFGNNFLKGKEVSSGLYWWELAYGTNGWGSFIGDCETWMGDIISSVENSGYASSVIYYDFLNETDNDVSNIWSYVNHMYDSVGVPFGRKGLSFLDANVDAAFGVANLGTRRLDYVDFHCYYPDGVNNNISYDYDAVENEFPDSTILIGEYGRKGGAETFDDEDEQQDEELKVLVDAVTNGVPYFIHWLLWDDVPYDGMSVGFGHDPDTAKHIMGSTAEFLNLLPNPDMEDLDADGEPLYWNAGGSDGSNPVLSCPGLYSGASSNYRYARVTADSENGGTVWMTSQRIDVAASKKLYVNAYIKSSMSDIAMFVKEYDQYDNITSSAGLSFTPTEWKWYNYTYNTGSWNVQLQNDTVKVLVGVVADVPVGVSILDVDTVSVWQR